MHLEPHEAITVAKLLRKLSPAQWVAEADFLRKLSYLQDSRGLPETLAARAEDSTWLWLAIARSAPTVAHPRGVRNGSPSYKRQTRTGS